MKVIDLLVQELPNRGGWPAGAVEAMSFNHNPGMIHFFDEEAEKVIDPIKFDGYKAPYIDTVTIEQYETAIAASNPNSWNGEGLPPANCECEVKSGKDSWTLCKVVHSSSAGAEFIYLEEPMGETSRSRYIGLIDCIPANHAKSYFRPIRTEAERKRDEAKDAIAELCRSSASNGHSADLIYDAIAAGKIPGVKLED